MLRVFSSGRWLPRNRLDAEQELLEEASKRLETQKNSPNNPTSSASMRLFICYHILKVNRRMEADVGHGLGFEKE